MSDAGERDVYEEILFSECRLYAKEIQSSISSEEAPLIVVGEGQYASKKEHSWPQKAYDTGRHFLRPASIAVIPITAWFSRDFYNVFSEWDSIMHTLSCTALGDFLNTIDRHTRYHVPRAARWTVALLAGAGWETYETFELPGDGFNSDWVSDMVANSIGLYGSDLMRKADELREREE